MVNSPRNKISIKTNSSQTFRQFDSPIKSSGSPLKLLLTPQQAKSQNIEPLFNKFESPIKITPIRQDLHGSAISLVVRILIQKQYREHTDQSKSPIIGSQYSSQKNRITQTPSQKLGRIGLQPISRYVSQPEMSMGIIRANPSPNPSISQYSKEISEPVSTMSQAPSSSRSFVIKSSKSNSKGMINRTSSIKSLPRVTQQLRGAAFEKSTSKFLLKYGPGKAA